MSGHYDDVTIQAAHDFIAGEVGWNAGDLMRKQAIDFLDAVAPLIAAKALRDAAESLSQKTEGPDRRGTATWPKRHRDIYSLAIEEAQAALQMAADEIERGT